MKKIFYALSLAAVLLTASCTKDATEDILNGGNNSDNQVAMTTITATIDNNQSRIHLGEEEDNYIPLYWSEGDVVYTNVYNSSATASEPISAADNGSEFATIKVAEGSTEIFVGVQQSLTKEGYIYIPSEQTYDSTKFANGNAIMLGAIDTETNTATLKHVCGYMKVSLTGSATVKKVMLRAIGHEPISGYHKYTIGTATTIYDYDKLGVADGYYTSPVITINCGEGVALTSEATDFYFAIPEGQYSKGFALTVLDSNNNQQTVAAYKSGKEIVAGKMIKMPALDVNCTTAAGIYDVNQFMGFARTLEKDCWIDNNNTLTLHADIDVKDESLANLRSLIFLRDNFETYNNSDMAIFDGNNKTIHNVNVSKTSGAMALLFYSVPSTLTVKNLTLGKVAGEQADSSLTITGTGSDTGYTYFGTFCNRLYGTIESCKSYATLDVTLTQSKGAMLAAFYVGSSGTVGTVKSCTNYGAITLNAPNSTAANWVGGISGRSYGSIENCTNSGAITVNSGSKKEVFIGGVIGQNVHTAAIKECTNTAEMNIETKGTTNLGGVTGLLLPNGASKTLTISNCSNSGNITLDTTGAVRFGGVFGGTREEGDFYIRLHAKTFENTGTLTLNAGAGTIYFGGVLGDFNGSKSSTTSCTNSGKIILNGASSNSWNYIGGIIGRSPSNATHNVAKNTETGDIEVHCTAKCRVGGIGGYIATAENCKAACDITIKNAGVDSNIGGITGYSNDTAKSDCEYKGKITNKANGVLVGGLAGCVNGTTWTDTYLRVELVSTGTNVQSGLVTTKAAGLNGGVPYTLTLGAEDKPFKISTGSTFNGIYANKFTVVDTVTEGKVNLYVHETGDFELALSKVNVQFAN